MTVVLVVDDVSALAEQYAYDLARLGGFETITETSGAGALDVLSRDAVDCVILDLEMPGLDGFGVLRSMRARELDVPVIVYTGTGDYDRCVRAVQLGASSFIDKGESMERVVHEVENVLERARLSSQVRQLTRELDRDSTLVGSSLALRKLQDAIARVAPIPSPVLILGESGTGKELVAREIHRLSGANAERGRRAERPFIAINCASLPEHLVESELFGHERGAFTGAIRLRKGAFEEAGDGTLFLDEIGELPIAMQAKLLRVLEQEEITRVGGSRPVRVRARVVTATNRDLELEIEEGRFRQDLYFRLNVHILRVPPLRDRRADIAELTNHFLATLSARLGVRPKGIDPDALDRLMVYDWRRNNVRELRNVIERLIIASDGDRIVIEDIPPLESAMDSTRRARASADEPSRARLEESDSLEWPTLAEAKAEAERQTVLSALERNDWHITNTARELGLADHSSLIKIMKRHGIGRNVE
jgi:DNA-binding NtrC family response regulator